MVVYYSEVATYLILGFLMLPFQNGEFTGNGHWIDTNAEGEYTVACAISDGPEGAKIHKLKRVFLKSDGSASYEEESTVTFQPSGKNGFTITITTAKGSSYGSGYCFERQCHYDLDVSPGVHIEFTYTIDSGRIVSLASSTNKGNFTSWTESLSSK